ncbi:hypothetical protein WICPIJ_001181 [Wickerhamomyces pijperi]|uniref:Ubiquitin carboxyl-terminal hydrolase n=1 Tax=Wickerhamomyces pijperi TaxID=599730 RepID=A0A9P8QB86_WICPI|nr:hypothetical protein WICPIJ_001181 [Wickerhamomyces pijperi]
MSQNQSAVIPLESNPQIFTQFAQYLGLDPTYTYHDVYSLDDPDLLSFIPRPVHSVILLFPITKKYEELKKSEDLKITSNDNIVWFRQTVKNACGLFALLNSLSNLDSSLYVLSSPIHEFIAHSKDPVKVEELIMKLKSDIYTHLAQDANMNSTSAPDESEDVNLHFLSFIKKDGHIYEMDGRRPGVWKLGEVGNTDSEDLLSEKLLFDRIKQFIDLTEGDDKLKFSVMALAPSFD